MNKIIQTFTPTIFYADGSSVTKITSHSEAEAHETIIEASEEESFSHATLGVVLTVEKSIDPAIAIAKAKALTEEAAELTKAAELAAIKDAKDKKGGA